MTLLDQIINKIADDPNVGNAKNGIGVTAIMAENIIKKRDGFPNHKFSSTRQIYETNGIGPDTANDIYYSFIGNIQSHILYFFNEARSEKEISEKIHDDPNFGPYSTQPRGIPFALAHGILKARKQQPKDHFNTLKELFNVSGVGYDTIHDIYYSFSN